MSRASTSIESTRPVDAVDRRWLRGVALFPLLYGVLFAGLAVALDGSGTLEPFVRLQRLLVLCFALAGCVAAASAMERGHPLRRAWLILAIATAWQLVRSPELLPSGSCLVAGGDLAAGLAILVGGLGLVRYMRGDLFIVPWGLLTASIFCLFIYGNTGGPGSDLSAEGFPLADLFRGLALNYFCAAGLAQRLVLSARRRGSS